MPVSIRHLGQCDVVSRLLSVYTFSGYDKAVQPVTIYVCSLLYTAHADSISLHSQGLVPGGSSFVLNPPKGPTSYDWIADVASGTSLVFIMTDSQGNQGGTSQIYLVNMSDDATCLDKNSPASVTNAPSATTPVASKPTKSATSSTSSATGTSAPDTSSDSKTSGGTIAAAIIGCIVALFIVGTLIWFYVRRRRGASVLKGRFFGKFQKKEVDLMHDPGLPPPATVSPYPLYHPQAGSQQDVVPTPNSTFNLLGAQPRSSGDPFADGAGSGYTPSAATFAHPPTTAPTSQFPPAFHRGSMHEGSVHGSAMGRPDEGSTASWDQTVTSGMRRKAAAAGVSPYAPSARFILHTDIEDDLPPPPEDEVIELPPQYSERRAPARPVAGPSTLGSTLR